VTPFFFGCEADDRVNAWAFNRRANPLGARLNAIFGSDIGHFDVPDMLEDRTLWEQRLRRLPMQRAGTPEDVAYGVLYLASDESSYVTGSELVIDGGTTAE
jgi:NAD(P)-dependent dehydrogenase (short-subunit alcohol dehydrogenase family)